MNQMLQRLPQLNIADPIEAEQGFDLREILNFVWRQWIFIASIVGVSLLVAVVWLARETPLYTATTQVLLELRKEKAAGTDAFLTDPILDAQMIDSQIAVIRSTVLMQRVVDKERLAFDPEFGTAGPRASETSLLGNVRSMFGGATASPAPATQAARPNEPSSSQVQGSIGGLKGATSVSKGQGFILQISVTSVDPKRAARLANAVADAYLVDKLETRFDAAKRATSWLSDRLADMRKQLRDSEEAVANFRAEHGISAQSNVTLTQQQLADLNVRLVTSRAETAEKKARVDLFLTSDGKDDAAQNIPDAINSSLAASLRGRASQVAQKLADLRARYSDNHPLVVNAKAELRDVGRALSAETQRAVTNMKNEYELSKARQESLEQTLRQVTGQSGLDGETMIKLRELERTAAVNKTLFEEFLQRARITQEQSTFEPQQARVITPAMPPAGPSHPRKNRTLMIALFIGLMLGVGGAYAKEMLNSGFTTPRQLEEMLEVPLLASVSRLEERDLTVDGKAVPLPIYPAVRPLSRYSEAMRALRSGIQMTDVDNPPKVIQVTSTVPGEGKTTIALSFATSAANSGLKVLFIDADLRHPSASRFVRLDKTTGLVDLLLGQAEAQAVIRYHDDAKFWILSAGSKTQNPPDLLGSERMRTLVAGFKKSFDLVVIDTPPLGPVIDPVVVSQLADKVVFVVRWAATARELVQSSMQQISGHKKVAGIVFNHVQDARAQKYGKYAYGYYYGSRYYKRYYSE